MMKKALIFFSLMLLVLSCSKPAAPEESKIGFTEFSLTTDREYKGDIDPISGNVSVKGITKAETITAVNYKLTSGASIYPKPESMIGNWKESVSFSVSSNGSKKTVTVTLADYQKEQVEVNATILGATTYGRKLDKFFFDAKGRPNYLTKDSYAQQFFYMDAMNGLRIPIYGDAVNGGHPEAGQVTASSYANVLTTVKSTRKYCSDNFTIMASKKLEGKTSFPSWVMESDGVNPEKYAAMIMDFLKYMKTNGVEIDVLGVDNETNYNEGNITPERYKSIVDNIKAACGKEGIRVPRFIGPERYSPELNTANCWVKKLFDSKWSDRMDIYGTHYYPQHHQSTFYSSLKFEVDYASSDGVQREFWATEPHWSSAAGDDLLMAAEQAMCAFWDMTDIGLDAFMWWDYNLSDSFRSKLMREVSLAMFHSQPIQMTDHDGTGTMTSGKLQTRAFRKDNEIVVFAINVQNKLQPTSSLSGYMFELKDVPVKSVSAKRWSDTSGTDGESVVVKSVDDTKFSLDLPSRSISIITIKTK